MGGGRAGSMVKRGGPLTHSQNFYKNFLTLTTKTKLKLNISITSLEEKPCKWGKVPDFSGLYKELPNKKVILGILYKFFWLKLFLLLECGRWLSKVTHGS
jgi:hypothetical protein